MEAVEPSRNRLASRLARLPRARVLGIEVPVAAHRRARLLGLSHLSSSGAGSGLLLPRCSSVHTFGMRFALDIVFLDDRRRPLSVHESVPPRRFVWHRGAVAVLELPAGGAGRAAEDPTALGGRA